MVKELRKGVRDKEGQGKSGATEGSCGKGKGLEDRSGHWKQCRMGG